MSAVFEATHMYIVCIYIIIYIYVLYTAILIKIAVT